MAWVTTSALIGGGIGLGAAIVQKVVLGRVADTMRDDLETKVKVDAKKRTPSSMMRLAGSVDLIVLPVMGYLIGWYFF